VVLKKPRRRQDTTPRLTVIETKLVPLSELRMYHMNPNVGDVDAIAIALNENGQFRPIVVNVGTYTGRRYEILAGNHTYLGARKELYYDGAGDGELTYKPAWDDVYVSFVDVDEERAAAIVLADNETAAKAKRDNDVVARLLQSLPKVKHIGTGYTRQQIDDIVERARASRNEALEDMERRRAADRATEEAIAVGSTFSEPASRLDDDDYEPPPPARQGAAPPDADTDTGGLDDIELTDRLTELQALLELREEKVYPFENKWGVPTLLPDMLVEELPEGLTTWAGLDATPDDGKKWFLYQYGLGGTKGLPYERSILCFYTHDMKFEGWWFNPAYYTARVISKGLTQAVCPDFSFYYTMPQVVHLHGVYKSQWLGRFFQEAGLRVIPRIQFANDASLEFNMLGIPKHPPVLAVSVQNNPVEGGTKEDGEQHEARLIQRCIDALEPTNKVLFYGGNPAGRVMRAVDLHGATGVHVLNYAAVRRGTVFDKKEGVASLTASQKKKIRKRVQSQHGEPVKVRTSMYDEDEDGDG
jgi:hypothetical protein